MPASSDAALQDEWRPGHFLRLRCSHHRRRILRYVHAAFAARQARPERHRVQGRRRRVGGTWYRNSYLGARCDSDSYVYCYTFDKNLLQEWDWSERYPEQDEILRYLEHCAERFDLKPDIQFGKRVVSRDPTEKEPCRRLNYSSLGSCGE
jgi:cation diffusion facilitator CzcD-associated flavoprotein CzcO